ncbi:MAG: hypothetical protein EOM21_19145 [Gammaproteobacteria bacterium]|nr:hypothetical protein [Gammaproteobacteria bacterium]
MASETTTTTVAELIPTIIEAALLELDDGDIIRPLVRNVQFGGPGIVHQTPFITRLTAETDDSLANQALDAGGSDETSPSAATVGAHGATVLLKDLAQMGSVSDLAVAAGQLIGQCLVVRREADLAALFASFTPNLGSANEDIVAADLYAAYKNLRQGQATFPFNLVLTPGQYWGTAGLITLLQLDQTNGIQSHGVGSVGEDVARNGWSGRVLGFDVYTSTNITTTSNNASGCAFSRDAIKYVEKRGIQIEVDREIVEVGDRVTGTGYWGEAILRNKHGVEMQFNEDT